MARLRRLSALKDPLDLWPTAEPKAEAGEVGAGAVAYLGIVRGAADCRR